MLHCSWVLVQTMFIFSVFLFYRLTILPPEEKLVPMFDRISKFHKEFMNKYRKGNDNDKPPQ